MLSILIPVYNYDVTKLISQLDEQCKLFRNKYEIIVIDDASDAIYQKQNRSIEKHENLNYSELESNIGRAAIRNLLARSAQYAKLLFLDSDCLLGDDLFISNYNKYLSNETKGLVCGGLRYVQTKPSNEYILHWEYGRSREALLAEVRSKNPSWYVHSSNILVDKEVFDAYPMDAGLDLYGYEDIAWGQQLYNNGFQITHIDNPVIHNGLKNNQEFISDVKHSLRNLSNLYKVGKVTETRLILTYQRLLKIGFIPILIFFIRLLNCHKDKAIASSIFRLKKLDLYKLYHFHRLQQD